MVDQRLTHFDESLLHLLWQRQTSQPFKRPLLSPLTWFLFVRQSYVAHSLVDILVIDPLLVTAIF